MAKSTLTAAERRQLAALDRAINKAKGRKKPARKAPASKPKRGAGVFYDGVFYAKDSTHYDWARKLIAAERDFCRGLPGRLAKRRSNKWG